MIVGNLFTHIPKQLPDELFETLLANQQVKIERIVSRQHSTPNNQWYDQEQHEWILIMQGSAGLEIEDQETITLQVGDYLHIPAHQRHQVVWTDSNEDTIWLAIHFAE